MAMLPVRAAVGGSPLDDGSFAADGTGLADEGIGGF